MTTLVRPSFWMSSLMASRPGPSHESTVLQNGTLQFVGGHLAQSIDIERLGDSVTGADEDADLVFHGIIPPC